MKLPPRTTRTSPPTPPPPCVHSRTYVLSPHLSLDLVMTATNGPLRRLYTPNRPSTRILVRTFLVGEPAAVATSIPASFFATTVTRAPPSDSGPRAMDRHCLLLYR